MNEDTVVILGAGPAGLAAAQAASRDGRSVVVVDDNPDPGGQIWRGGPAQWRDPRAAKLWACLRARPGVRWLFGARLVSALQGNAMLLDTQDGPLTLPWQRLILCTGARELLLPFPGWTLPGVTGAGGMQALIKGGMPVAGKQVLVAGTGPLLLAVADTVRRNGGEVVAIAEQRPTSELARFALRLAPGHAGKLVQAAQLVSALRGIPYLHAATVHEAAGDKRLSKVLLDHGGVAKEISCDFLACGFGLVPALEVARLFGCAVDQGRVSADALQRTSVANIWAAGESTGIGGVDKALAEGTLAGLDAAGVAPSARDRRAVVKAAAFADLLARSFAPRAVLRKLCQPSTIVCRCEDVRAQELAAHDGWRSAKLQTRVGMGPCQGRVCGAACEFLYGWEAGSGRPPVFPVSAGTLAAAGELTRRPCLRRDDGFEGGEVV